VRLPQDGHGVGRTNMFADSELTVMEAVKAVDVQPNGGSTGLRPRKCVALPVPQTANFGYLTSPRPSGSAGRVNAEL
jgi:hypothetical protein